MNRSAILAMILLLAVACMMGGCTGFAYLVAQLAPPKKVKPLFELPKNKKVLVLVDNDAAVTYEPIKNDLTDELNRLLVEHKIAGSTVSYARLQDALDAARDARMPISTIGEKTGADLVLYVKVERFSVKDDEATPLWTGRLQATVLVIDVKAAMPGSDPKIWPTDRSEYIMPAIELEPVDDMSPNFGSLVARKVALKAADKISKLFYEYTVPASGEKPDGPL